MAVATCIVGGLGNQLFQYATGYALARKNNDKFLIDVSQFKYYSRPYALSNLNISAEILNVKPATKNTKLSKMIARLRRLNATGGIFSTKWLQETSDKQYMYSYPDIHYSKNIYLNGYWQSWHYFTDYREKLKSEFSPRGGILSKNVQELIDAVGKENSVAIHIRRGDYLQCDGWLINEAFYVKAIDMIKDEIGEGAKFYVFCEDKDFAVRLFTDLNYVLVTGMYDMTDIEEFFVMSACRHHIISNSSFSWWAAYLSKSNAGVKIAPVFKQWNRDFYLPDWKCIDMNCVEVYHSAVN